MDRRSIMKIKNQWIALFAVCIIFSMAAVLLTGIPVSAAASYNNMQVAAGSNHALLIDSEGNVWAFGNNDYGQLGDGSTVTRDNPVMVYSHSWKGKATSVAAGSKQSLVLLADGTVLIWGYGDATQKTEISQNAVAISAGGELCMAILKSGTAVCWSDKLNQRTIETTGGVALSNVREISAGSNNFLLVRAGSNGAVYQLDIDNYRTANRVPLASQNGSGDPLNSSSEESGTSGSTSTEYLKDAVGISAGADYGIALLNSGDVCSWGNTDNGVLGRGYLSESVIGEATKIEGLSSISKISAGSIHAIAANGMGVLFGWGSASQGRLGPSESGTKYSPSALQLSIGSISQFDCGNTFNLSVSSNGEFYFWGASKDPAKLVLKQSLIKTGTPTITTSQVGDQTMTVTWNPSEFYTEMATGFMLSYTMPDGTTGRTQLLPLTQSQITLRGLQAATNYSMVLSIMGKTGFEDKTAAFMVQTAKDDGISPSPEPTVVTPSAVPTNTLAASSSVSDGGAAGTGKFGNWLNIMLIVLVFIILAGAIAAIIYVWKRLDKETDTPKIKSVHVSVDDAARASSVVGNIQGGNGSVRTPAAAANVVTGEPVAAASVLSGEGDDSDMKIVMKPAPEGNHVVSSEEDGIPVVPEQDDPAGDNRTGENQNSENRTGEGEDQAVPGDITPELGSMADPDEYFTEEPEEGADPEDSFLTRLPDTTKYDDDDDDFIVRRPGDPRR